MAILKWRQASSPDTTGSVEAFNALERFQEEMDRWLGWSRYPEMSGLFDRSAYPALDIVDTAEGCTVWADIPGLDKKDLDLAVTANVLTLKGEKKGNRARQSGPQSAVSGRNLDRKLPTFRLASRHSGHRQGDSRVPRWGVENLLCQKARTQTPSDSSFGKVRRSV